MHRVHQLTWFLCVILNTYLNKEDTGCWCWMVVHIDCHENGCYYNEDQDENSNNEPSMKGSPFLLGCTVICRSWKKSTAVRIRICTLKVALSLARVFIFLIKYHWIFFTFLQLFISIIPILEVRYSLFWAVANLYWWLKSYNCILIYSSINTIVFVLKIQWKI